jgi:hypothetical protein
MFSTKKDVAKCVTFFLGNCQEMARSVDDTVNEIELEAKNQHTEGWVSYAYFKVFNKWLNNLGCTSATFEHIEDAATRAFDSEEDKKRIDFIKRFDFNFICPKTNSAYNVRHLIVRP